MVDFDIKHYLTDDIEIEKDYKEKLEEKNDNKE